MSSVNGATTEEARSLQRVYAASVVFFLATCAVSYARWANFEYRTFDLAYYVQAIWQLIHGRMQVSVLPVPLLGNHVEPIVLVFAPFFALIQHPLLFVVVQNAALASMAPVGFNLARRLGITRSGSTLLAVALLVTPASGFIALHEFHPEALTAPCLLLLLQARAAGSLRRHWLWFAAALACKENTALLLSAYCVVHLVLERGRPMRQLWNWYGWPLAASIGWFFVCARIITPALNAGDIDYLALYSHLGGSAEQILANAARRPQLILASLWHACAAGNLVWALLLPFLALPLVRMRWLVVASPVLLQHLLSWRSSEWMIYFHYAAPLLPLFWIGMAEAVAQLQSSRMPPFARQAIPLLVVLGCVVEQGWLGPAAGMISTAADWGKTKTDRNRKSALVAAIPEKASVLAPLPYLSHLAMREHCYSLHHVLKGLKTLSHERYQPPPATDFVLVDHRDTATFDATAGYYHPTMKTSADTVVPSSDELLHKFLAPSTWTAEAADEFVVLSRAQQPLVASDDAAPDAAISVGVGTTLLAIRRSSERIERGESLSLALDWRLDAERQTFPWLELVLQCDASGERTLVTKGLCAPQVHEGLVRETWQITRTENLTCGTYHIEARFVDNPKRTWSNVRGVANDALLCAPIPLGDVTIVDAQSSTAPNR